VGSGGAGVPALNIGLENGAGVPERRFCDTGVGREDVDGGVTEIVLVALITLAPVLRDGERFCDVFT